jgi:hypothetical protein
MRLAREHTKQQSCGQWAAVDEQGGRAEQPCGQQSVLPHPNRPQHRRESEDRDQDRPAAFAENSPDDQTIKTEGNRLEDDKGPDVGQLCERGAKQ